MFYVFKLWYDFKGFTTCEHGFAIKLKYVKILNFIVSGCILYTKIPRIVIFELVFLLCFLRLPVGNGFQNEHRHLFSMFSICGMILKEFTTFLYIFINVLNYEVVDFIC